MHMARMSKMVGFTVPVAMAEELEMIAREEQRTKSELFREMFRVYRTHRQRRQDEEANRPLVSSPVSASEPSHPPADRKENSIKS